MKHRGAPTHRGADIPVCHLPPRATDAGRNACATLLAFLFALCLAAPHARAQGGAARPEVWMAPPGHDNGRCFRDLFEKPDEWKYRLDVNWANFIVQNHGCWGDVRKIEQQCRARKLPFSLIYWASGQPLLQRKGLAGESTWYTSIMQQGYAYAMVDGRPDQYVIESWVSAPSQCVPETGEWTFTRSVRDFVKTFVMPRP